MKQNATTTKHKRLPAAFRAAFPFTIPVLAGYLFLGLGFGVLMNVAGFSPLWPFFMSILIYGGAMQYIAVGLLTAKFDPLAVLLVSLMVQARHIFYGIAMLDRYNGTGARKYYLIDAMTDETFSVNYTAKIPEGVDARDFYFAVSLMDHCYWIAGSTLGGVLGSFLPFSTEGLDFVMTAMFVVILLNQLMHEKKHWVPLIGVGASVVALLVFGAESFLLPAMGLILALLLGFKKPLERKGDLV